MKKLVGIKAIPPVALLVLLIVMLWARADHTGSPKNNVQSSPEPEVSVNPVNRSPQNPVDFIREHVAMDVENDRVIVTGTYWFRVNEPRSGRFPIMYPFPVDENHEYPSRIQVIGADGEPVEYMEHPESSSIRFAMDLSLPPEFTVIYTQRIHQSEATYILTTTSAWERPLDHAAFTVSMPETYALSSISYEYDDLRSENSRRVYSFSRENFMPEHDLTVSWKYQEEAGL